MYGWLETCDVMANQLSCSPAKLQVQPGVESYGNLNERIPEEWEPESNGWCFPLNLLQQNYQTTQ